MDAGAIIFGGGVVMLLWLHAVHFDEVHRASAKWFPWVPVTESQFRLRPLYRVVAKVVAVVGSVAYGLYVAALVAHAVR